MSEHDLYLCCVVTLIVVNIYMLIQTTLQMRHNIKFRKRLERIRLRLALKEAKIDLLKNQLARLAKVHAPSAEI